MQQTIQDTASGRTCLHSPVAIYDHCNLYQKIVLSHWKIKPLAQAALTGLHDSQDCYHSRDCSQSPVLSRIIESESIINYGRQPKRRDS